MSIRLTPQSFGHRRSPRIECCALAPSARLSPLHEEGRLEGKDSGIPPSKYPPSKLVLLAVVVDEVRLFGKGEEAEERFELVVGHGATDEDKGTYRR